MRPLENSLAIWKKSQKDKKDTAAAAKKKNTEEKEKEDSNEKSVADKGDENARVDNDLGDAAGAGNEKVDDNKENNAE